MVTAIQEIEIDAEGKQLAESAELALTEAMNYKITTPVKYSSAAMVLKQIKEKSKIIEAKRKSLTSPIDEAKKRIMDFFRKPLELLAQAEEKIKDAMLDFQRAEDQKRAVEEAKARAEAEKKQKELDRKAKEAAKEFAKQGDTATANAIMESVPQVQPKEIATRTPEIRGISKKTIWRYKVIDIEKLPRGYMIPDDIKLGQIARATKGTVKVPGVEFYSEEIIAAGS